LDLSEYFRCALSLETGSQLCFQTVITSRNLTLILQELVEKLPLDARKQQLELFDAAATCLVARVTFRSSSQGRPQVRSRTILSPSAVAKERFTAACLQERKWLDEIVVGARREAIDTLGNFVK